MKIAVICWGSVFWDKGSLKTLGDWKSDGPELPIEFCRIASHGKSKEKIIPVINVGSSLCVTYWDLLVATDLKTGRNNLRDREGTVTDDIETFLRNENPLSEAAVQIDLWLSLHPEIDAVVWNGLKSNWSQVRNSDFSTEGLVDYLEEKKNLMMRTKESFEKAPRQIKTQTREIFKTWWQSKAAQE